MTTIPQSTTYDNNLTTKAYSSKLSANAISDGIATFSQGTIVDLVPPTGLQDAVNKGFVIGSANPGAPENSVQFNNLVFEGSSNLLFTQGAPSELVVGSKIKVLSDIDITSGVISGLDNPTEGDQIATKSYVDSISSISNNTYIASNTAVVYTPSQMINGIILRNLATDAYGVIITDTTPTAAEFVALGGSNGYCAKFMIINTDSGIGPSFTGDGFTVNINPGTGVTFSPSGPFNLLRGYVLSANIIFTDVIIPAVTIVINSCNYVGQTMYLNTREPVPSLGDYPQEDYVSDNSIALTGNILCNTNNNIITDINYAYTDNDIKNRIIVRNPSGISTDVFSGILDPRLIKQIINIQNISAFDITLTGQTNIWKLVPDPFIIPAGYQCMIQLSTESLPSSSSNQGTGYEPGIYNTIGGTGTGMTVKVVAVYTYTSTNNDNSGYLPGDSPYPTTNLTNPLVSGLLVSGTNTGGKLSNVYPSNYLADYQNGDQLLVIGGDNNAIVTLTNVNAVFLFDIESLGNGAYLIDDLIEINGGGPGSGKKFSLGTTGGNYFNIQCIGKILI